MILTAPTEVVEIPATVTLAWHDDESLLTASAPQNALEVVIVRTIARPATPQSEHLLHPVEYFKRHQRFVTAGVLLALVFDDAKVVAVLQHLIQLAQRQRTRQATFCAARPEASICQRLEELRAGVLTGGK
nr:hypothetical protein [Amycolatopsis sp. CA-126428]